MVRPRNWGRFAATAAGVLLLGSVGAVLMWSRANNAPVAVDPVETPPGTATPEPPPGPQAASEEEVVSQDPVELKLLKIGSLLQQSIQQGLPFPAEKETPGRSWIAKLAETELAGVPAHWERGWDAPVNDPFVRRRFDLFDNPHVAAKAGEDHYPATHFVGVSGVGADAARLPAVHPRSGIFSASRTTKTDDVKDGLSNTMLVAGVESKLGSWARPGGATIRSFTAEPYIRGPDGFGTGQADEMQVLMADGSVRRISSQTDPVVVRRMAAMADGLSLDPQVAGDPLQVSVPSAQVVPEMPAVADAPIMVDLALDLPAFDFKPRLQQKVVLFEISRPIALQDAMFDLQELLGAPLDLSGLETQIRERPVLLTLQEVTVEDILRQLCEKAGVKYTIGDDRIFIATP